MTADTQRTVSFSPDGGSEPVEVPHPILWATAKAAKNAALRTGFGQVMRLDIDDDPASVTLAAIAYGANMATNFDGYKAAYAALLTTTDTISTRYEVLRYALEGGYEDDLVRRLSRDLAQSALEQGMSIVTAPKARWRQGYAFPTVLSPKRLARFQRHDDAREYETWQEIPVYGRSDTVVLIVSADTRPMTGVKRMTVTDLPQPEPEPEPTPA